MTVRTVTKSLAGMEDLAAGIGNVVQQRGGTQVTVGKIDQAYAVLSLSDLQDLDVALFTYATYDDDEYRYDATDTSGIPSNVGPGSWIIAGTAARQKETTNLDAITIVTEAKVTIGFNLYDYIGKGIRVAGVGLWLVPDTLADGSPMPDPALLDAVPTDDSITVNGGTQVILSGGLSKGRVTALNAAIARSFEQYFADELNPLNYGADNTGVEDSADILIKVFSAASLFGLCVKVPAGVYRVSKPLGKYTKAFTIKGDGNLKTWFKLDDTMTGTFLQIEETGFAISGWAQAGNTIEYDDEVSGMVLRDFSVVGNLDSAQQTGILFTGRNDNVSMSDVYLMYMRGSGLSVGTLGAAATGYMRESSFYNVQVRVCGSSTQPAFVFTTQGSGDASNQVDFFNLKVVWSNDDAKAFSLINRRSGAPMRRINFYSLMVHSKESVPNANNLVEIIGDVRNCGIHDLKTNAGGTWGLVIDRDATSLLAPQSLRINGSQTTGHSGIDVRAGRSLTFEYTELTSDNDDFKVGPLVDGPVEFKFPGSESVLQYNIDPSVRKWVSNVSSRAEELPLRSERFVLGVDSNDPTYLGYSSGSPEGVVGLEGNPGTLIVNQSGTTQQDCDRLFVKTTGSNNTGYRNVQMVAGGNTAGRPGTPTLYQMYWDNQIKKAVWWDGTNWLDSQGVIS